MGRRIRGKLRLRTRPALLVTEDAPFEKEFEKNVNKKTPVNKKGMKLSGRASPNITPKINPKVAAWMVGSKITHHEPRMFLALAA